MDKIHLLSTDRLNLVVPDASFAEAMVDYLIRNKTYFKGVFHTYPHYYQSNFWRRVLARMPKHFQKNHLLYLVLQCKERPTQIIGNIVFDGLIRGPMQSCYLGYKLDENHTGEGLMQEALRPSIEYIFEQWKLHRIMANYRPDNTDSERLLKKLGFREEGFAKNYLYVDDAWRDHVLTALHNDRLAKPGDFGTMASHCTGEKELAC